MSSEDWSVVSYEEAEEDDLVVLSQELRASALVNALHDSPLRSSNATRCSLGTHVVPKQEFSEWLAKHSPQNNHRAEQRSLSRFNLLWLHGAAGTGKTTLMQTLADVLLPPIVTSVSASGEDNNGPPTYESTDIGSAGVQYAGAAVFFSKEHQLTDVAKIFTTIAFGLADRLPPLATFIQSAFDDNKYLVEQTSGRTFLKEQAEALIFRPIQTWVTAEDGDVDVDFIILVDGLDECDDQTTQMDVIGAVRDVFTRKISGVSWSWVFSSRTDDGLQEEFVGASVAASPKAEEIVVDFATDAEMDAFLDSKFAEIRRTHPAFHAQDHSSGNEGSSTSAPSSTEEEWPSPHDKAVIKWQAVGLYAAASSIIEFVADPHDDPRSRIHLVDNSISSKEPGLDSTPYTKLDRIYKDILARVPLGSVAITKRILGAIACQQPSAQDQKPPTIAHIAALFDLKTEAVYQYLRYLHSVISAPFKPSSRQATSPKRIWATSGLWENEGLTFRHPSFYQFLRTPSRSGDWAMNPEAIHLDLAQCCLRKLTSGCPSSLKEFLEERWYIHCWRTGKDTEAALGILPDLFEFDYSLLNNRATMDRYFVEWLLHIQDTTLSEYQLLNHGPSVRLRIVTLPGKPTLGAHLEQPDAGPSSSTLSENDKEKEKEKTSPPRQSYILGIEPGKQVYLVPFYDVKVQQRADIGQVIGPGLKYWDWIRGFVVIPRYQVEDEEFEDAIEESSLVRFTGSEGNAAASVNNDTEDEGLYV